MPDDISEEQRGTAQRLASRYLKEMAQNQSQIGAKDFTATIKSLAIAVDVVVATVATQVEADAADDTLQGLVTIEEGDKVTVESVPLYAACLRGRAVLANGWPVLRPPVLQATRRFLLRPSPILVQLQQAGEQGAIDSLHREACDGLVALLRQSTDADAAGNDHVIAFLSSLSASSSTVSDDKQPLVAENVVKALVAVACDLPGRDGASVKHCISLLYQKLFFPPSPLDAIILGQLGIMATRASDSAFSPVADVLVQVIRRTYGSQLGGNERVSQSKGASIAAPGDELSDDPAKYRFILQEDAVASTLNALGRDLVGPAQRYYLLQRLFEVFRALAMDARLARETAGNEAWVGALIPAMGLLARGTPIKRDRSAVVVFRDFWFHAVVAGLVGQRR